jgi:NitT/TauT family transport system permease protein
VALSTSEMTSSGRRGRALAIAGPVAVIGGGILAWQLAAVPAYVLPHPSDVAAVFLTQPQVLWRHSVVTATEVLASFGVCIVTGIPIGALAVKSTLFNRGVYPLIVASQAIPILAAAPLLVVWFGFGLAPKVIVAVLITFFPVIVGTATGLRALPAEYGMLSTAIGLSKLRRFVLLEWPAALPNLFAGLKIASVLVVVGAVVGEFVGASAGLGYLVLRSAGRLDNATLFAALLIMVGMGVIIFAMVAMAERLLIPWRFSRSE